MENILSVEETKTRLICELSTVTGFKYLKSGILKKTVKDIVFEINFSRQNGMHLGRVLK